MLAVRLPPTHAAPEENQSWFVKQIILLTRAVWWGERINVKVTRITEMCGN